MIFTMMFVSVLAQQAPAAKTADPALFAALIRTTNALPAFVVEYEATVQGQDVPAIIRILYRAPDRAKLVIGDKIVFRIQDGSIDVRSSVASEKPMSAHVPIAKMNHDRFEQVATAMRAEFPACADEWSESGGAGIRFDLSVQDDSNPSTKTLQFMASTASSGSVLFGWLEDLPRKPSSVADVDRLVFEEPDGLKITLSTRTGFIEKIEQPRPAGMSTFQIASLDLSPEFEETAFDLPPPAADATDASASFAQGLQLIQSRGLRKRAIGCVAKLVADKKIEWGPEVRGRLAKVFDAIHGSAWRLENEVWITEMQRRMGEFAAWFRDRLRDVGLVEPEARKQIEESVTQWRQSLLQSAGSGLDPRLSSLTIESDVIADETLRKDILELEREVVKATLQSALVEPLLRAFDQKIAEARQAR